MASYNGTKPALTSTVTSEKLRVAFLGPEGTYSHQAAFNRFRENATYIEKKTIADVFKAVPSEASVAVIPSENSTFGPVVETLDLLRLPEAGKNICIREEIVLQVQHCLVVVQGAKLEDVERVLSHEQALGQCSRFLKTHLPRAVLGKTPSTAAAAEAILNAEMKQNSAAICSEVCLTVHPGLVLLEKGIQDVDDNFTKFWIMSSSAIPPIPQYVTESQKALIRVSSSSSSGIPSATTLSKLVLELGLEVYNIDRRPSTQCIPFHNVYFLYVSRLSTKSAGEAVCWEDEVKCALEHARRLGWETCILGYW